MTEEKNALRGLWGANRGPKMTRKKRQNRKIAIINLEPEVSDNVKGWKANR